jgi:protein-L-isoaspartate(D-aspartate) O-methyltransferase
MGDVGLAEELRTRGITDERVLRSIASLDRATFVPPGHSHEAAGDFPIPIGHGQTISQPYIVAFMTQELRLTGKERLLEVGTGSGYQAAVLAPLCAEVYSIEIIPELAQQAAARLSEQAFENVFVRQGDGYSGWADKAPFDAVILTAAPSRIPEALIAQVRPGGRLIAPVGPADTAQELVLLKKGEDGTARFEKLLPVRFVPMTGEAQSL